MASGGVQGPGLRARIGAVLAPALGLTCWLWPLPLPGQQHRLLAIVVATVILWVSEALPIAVTALLIAPALVAAGITDARTAFHPYADPLLFLFYGSFFIAMSLQRHGLDRRVARAIVGSRLVAGVPWRSRLSMMFSGNMLSMWISNTGSTAMLMPILLGTEEKDEAGPGEDGDANTPTGERRDGRARTMTGSLLAIAFACSVGGMGTLVGTPPNLITVGLLDKATGVRIDFVQWAMLGVPAALLLCMIIFAVFARSYPTPAAAPNAEAPQPIGTPMSRGEWVTALSFGLAVVGWVTPALAKAVGAPFAPALGKALPAGSVAMLAAGVLFMFRDGEGETVLPWRRARDIDWGLIMLFGGGISLGTQMFDTGLAETLGRGFISLTGVAEMWTLTAVAIGFTIFFTEICSNTATSNMVVPLVIGVTTELGVSPVPPCLGVALAASCAFMMPIATGPNAVVYGTGRIALTDMLRVGLWLNLLCGVSLWLLLRVMCPLLGWA